MSEFSASGTDSLINNTSRPVKQTVVIDQEDGYGSSGSSEASQGVTKSVPGTPKAKAVDANPRGPRLTIAHDDGHGSSNFSSIHDTADGQNEEDQPGIDAGTSPSGDIEVQKQPDVSRPIIGDMAATISEDIPVAPSA